MASPEIKEKADFDLNNNYFRYLFPKIVKAPFSKGLPMGIRGKAIYVPEFSIDGTGNNGKVSARIATFIEFVIEMPDGEVKSALTIDSEIEATLDL